MAQADMLKGRAATDVLVFVSYSHRDDKAREQFDIHAAQLKREGVQFWFDGDITPGAELDPNIMRQLKAADVFVALASPDYLHSTYCFEKEYSQALRKAKRGKVYVVVALIKQCQWRHTRMAHYKMLPRDAKPVAQWVPRGDAYENIIEGLREVVKAVRAGRAYPITVPSRVAAKPVRPRAAFSAGLKAPATPARSKKADLTKVKRAVSKKPSTKSKAKGRSLRKPVNR